MKEEKRLLKYNLQFFAKEGPGGEKTEDATSKKKEDTRKEGQVAKSNELNMAASLLALFIALKVFISYIGDKLLGCFNYFYSLIPDYANNMLTGQAAHGLIQEIMKRILVAALPFLIIGVVAAFLINKVQIKWMVTFKPMEPKFSKLDPIKGFQKLFSKEKLFNLVKELLKIIAISYLVYETLKDQWKFIYVIYDISINNALSMIFDIVINLGMKISVLLLVIGAIDWFYQQRKHKEDIKMTKQEVKDEYKNAEGDPKIKSRIKSKMLQASQRRMMNSVPEADVVITNPTHFAVAIKYDSKVGRAPKVIAKGADFVAARIKEKAKENNVEIVENKPLARMLYYNVDLDAEIPEELYQSVAEVLAYVYKLKNKVS